MSETTIVHVHLLPSLIPLGSLRGGIAVVLDVLRATTVMTHALASGCLRVVPCLEIDEAFRIAKSLPKGSALLGGERAGLPIEGFDFGNSPEDYTRQSCEGRTLVMTTTNGTKAILASTDADRVLIGSFPNLSATIEALRKDGRPIHVVCAGTEGHVSWEDSLLAGAILSKLTDDPHRTNDSGLLSLSSWREAETAMRDAGKSLADIFARGRGGRRVTEIGLVPDILASATIDRFDLVAELSKEPLEIVKR